MGFGIDNANRLVITKGYKSIITPRKLDFNDFPTALTILGTTGGTPTTTNYTYWDLVYNSSGNDSPLNKIQNQNNGRLYIDISSTSSYDSNTIYVINNRNIKGALLNFGISYWLGASAQYTSGSVKAELVKPDGTNLITLYSKSNDELWGWLSYNIWWSGDTCYVNSIGCMLTDYQADNERNTSTTWRTYFNNGSNNTYNSYTVADSDVRLKVSFSANTGDTSNDSYTKGYISNVLLG